MRERRDRDGLLVDAGQRLLQRGSRLDQLLAEHRSEHSMQASSNRPPTETARMMAGGRWQQVQLGKKLVMPSISSEDARRDSISATTSAATVDTGMPPMRLPAGHQLGHGQRDEVEVHERATHSDAEPRSEATKSLRGLPAHSRRTALSSPLRICSYPSCAGRCAWSSPSAARPTCRIGRFSFSSFNIGHAVRILCRLAVASRYSCSAFFSPDLAVLWISSSNLLHTLSPVAGILAQPGGLRAPSPAAVGRGGAALLVVRRRSPR